MDLDHELKDLISGGYAESLEINLRICLQNDEIELTAKYEERLRYFAEDYIAAFMRKAVRAFLNKKDCFLKPMIFS
jgi:hypothetical protein